MPVFCALVAVALFDRILAVTLLGNGVMTLHTHHQRDFAEFGFQRLVNPVDE